MNFVTIDTGTLLLLQTITSKPLHYPCVVLALDIFFEICNAQPLEFKTNLTSLAVRPGDICLSMEHESCNVFARFGFCSQTSGFMWYLSALFAGISSICNNVQSA